VKRVLLVAALVALGALVTASVVSATPTDAAAVQAKAGASPIIGYIHITDRIPFGVLVRKNIEAAAKANGAVLRQCNADLDAQKAIDCAKTLKQQRVQGIINFQAFENAGRRVCTAGPNVPVVSIDIHQRPCEDVFFGANNFYAGRLAGAAIGQAMKSRFNCQIDAYVDLNAFLAGEVVLIRGRGLRAGYESVCGKVAADKVKKVDGGGTTDGSIQPMRDTLQTISGNRIVVVSTNDDMIIGAIRAAEGLGRAGDIYTAGQGADPTSWPYLCRKQTFKNWVADTAYFPEKYGDRVVPILLSLMEGQPQPKVVYTPHRVITPANIKTIYRNACR
jgi:ribose transport system substrate-binding protein